MESNWVPASAAALVTGAIALFLGTLLMPAAVDGGTTTLQLVRDEHGRWLAVALLQLTSAVAVLLGLPCAVGLLLPRTKVLGFVGLVLLVVSCAITAGYGILLLFVRSLVLVDGVRPGALGDALDDPVMTMTVSGWLASFALGEALVAVALLRGHTTPRWIPMALLLHALTLPVAAMLPELLAGGTKLLLVVGLAGIAIEANKVRDRAQFRRMTSSHH